MKAFVIFRDRMSYGRQCVSALQQAGFDVHIVDHNSTYIPAVRWMYSESGVPVISVPNQHPQDMWKSDLIRDHVGTTDTYLVTDCDVVPDAPSDWPIHLRTVLAQHQDRVKVGLGLRLDIPDHYEHRDKVLDWEAPFSRERIAANVYSAPVDTTLAMYQPLSLYPQFQIAPAARTGHPYVARHLTWYENSADLTEEQVYYRANMNRDYSHWIDPGRYA